MIEEDRSNGRWHLSHRLQSHGDGPRQGLAVKMDHRAARRVSSKRPSKRANVCRVTNNSIHPGYCNFIRSKTSARLVYAPPPLPSRVYARLSYIYIYISFSLSLSTLALAFLHLPLTVAFYESPMHDDHFISEYVYVAAPILLFYSSLSLTPMLSFCLLVMMMMMMVKSRSVHHFSFSLLFLLFLIDSFVRK